MDELPSTAGLRRAIRESDRYVRQYSFRSDSMGSAPTASILVVEFESKTIVELLRSESLPIWRLERPRTLIWYEYSSQDEAKMLSDSDISSIPWKQTAYERGVPLIVPLMDLEDRKFVTDASVSGRFDSDFLQASARYNAELIVIVRSIALHFERQRIFVELWSDELNSMEMSFDAVPGETVAVAVVGRIAKILAKQFAILPHQASTFRIAIRGIDSIREYKSVMTIVGQYELIDTVAVASVSAGLLELKISTPMSQQQLSSLLSTSDSLHSVAADSPAGGEELLAFDWIDK